MTRILVNILYSLLFLGLISACSKDTNKATPIVPKDSTDTTTADTTKTDTVKKDTLYAWKPGQKHTFTLGDQNFLLDGKLFKIISGELHYLRIPEPYWKDRLEKAKAMGLNTISIYCMWNAHEPRKGVWDFSGRQDVRKFVALAEEEGLFVIVRPGPYICGEWEFGGLPWWLLKSPNNDLKVRTYDPRFMQPAREYMMQIGKELADMQVADGGPIIMVQAANEYGTFGSDERYKDQIAQDIRDAGFTVPLFTADPIYDVNDGATQGVLPGVNGKMLHPNNVKNTVNQNHGGKGPYFVPETYPGWLDHWGHRFETRSATPFVNNMKDLLNNNVSINIYMWHGGTNFGFMAGANYTGSEPIEPDLTSYDYDAPLSESGYMTPKYMDLRDAFKQFLPEGEQLPPLPDQPTYINIPNIQLTQAAALFDNLSQPIEAANVMSMEDLGQGYGYVLYRTTLAKDGNGNLHIEGLRDYAQVFINGERVGIISHRKNDQKDLHIQFDAGDQLDILVENMGRINWGDKIVHSRKGIIGDVSFKGYQLTGWKMYRLPFKNTQWIDFKPNKGNITGPVMYKGTFSVSQIGDTFLDMSNWGKGIVFVNGHNLGRYWNIGPQETLYLPGCWLKTTGNIIVVYEQLQNGKNEISAIDHPIISY